MTRKPDGTFAPGGPGGPGRPPRPVESAYLRALSDACDLTTWGEICARAVADAKGGDAAARAWLGRYLCGAATLRGSLTMVESMALLDI